MQLNPDPLAQANYVTSINSIQSEVTDTVRVVEAWLSDNQIPDDYIGNIALVLAEAMNNVIEHAFAYSKTGTIDLNLWSTGNDVIFKLSDNGSAMAGLPKKKKMDGHLNALEELPEGGFGWFLIHSLSKELEYERNGTQNELTIRVSSTE